MKKIKIMHVAIVSLIIWILFNITDMVYVMNLNNFGGSGPWLNPVIIYGKFAKWILPIFLFLGLGLLMKKELNRNRVLILGLPIMLGYLTEEIVTTLGFGFSFSTLSTLLRISVIPGLAYILGLIIVGVSIGAIWILRKIKTI